MGNFVPVITYIDASEIPSNIKIRKKLFDVGNQVWVAAEFIQITRTNTIEEF
jgi:hypothetical protein